MRHGASSSERRRARDRRARPPRRGVRLGRCVLVGERLGPRRLGRPRARGPRRRSGSGSAPCSRRRPATGPGTSRASVASVDRLSAGRVILGVGLGALNGNWLAFEPDEGRAVRARRLDEVLDVYAGLMAGRPFTYAGEFFTVREVTELVPPRRSRHRIRRSGASAPTCPDRSRQRSLERAARWQGVFPAVVGGGVNSGLTLESLTEIVARLRDAARGGRPAVDGLRRRRRG